MKKQPTEKEAVEIIAHYKFSDTQTETAEQIADKILSLGRTQAISEFKEKLKEEIKEVKGRGKVIIRETDIGEYEKFICTYKLFNIIDKTAQELLGK